MTNTLEAIRMHSHSNTLALLLKHTTLLAKRSQQSLSENAHNAAHGLTLLNHKHTASTEFQIFYPKWMPVYLTFDRAKCICWQEKPITRSVSIAWLNHGSTTTLYQIDRSLTSRQGRTIHFQVLCPPPSPITTTLDHTEYTTMANPTQRPKQISEMQINLMYSTT